METLIVSGLIVSVILSIIAGIAMWKYYHFFISRRDRYVNSPFDLVKKRLGMSISVGLGVLTVFVMIANQLTDKSKNKENKTIQTTTLTDKNENVKENSRILPNNKKERADKLSNADKNNTNPDRAYQ